MSKKAGPRPAPAAAGERALEELLVGCCAPTLSGARAGGVFGCTQGSAAWRRAALRRLDGRLAPCGVRVLRLREDGARALVYVCRPAAVAAALSARGARRLLAARGYREGDMRRCLRRLMRRLARPAGGAEDFPHEMGLFLGYPAADVRGFIRHGGQNCRLSGPWKVYGSVARARVLFFAQRRRADACRRRWRAGVPLERLAARRRF